ARSCKASAPSDGGVAGLRLSSRDARRSQIVSRPVPLTLPALRAGPLPLPVGARGKNRAARRLSPWGEGQGGGAHAPRNPCSRPLSFSAIISARRRTAAPTSKECDPTSRRRNDASHAHARRQDARLHGGGGELAAH